MSRIILTSAVCLSLVLTSCKEEPAAAPAGGTSPTAAKPTTTPPAADRHAPAASAGHGGQIIELGTTKIGEWTVRASRDQGEIKAGGDTPIDVWVTTADGKPATVTAVRFWIGTEDAKGSIKAKADIEIPAEPNHWHTHAEVPSPLPAGAKLWVEIEAEGSGKKVGSFDLKQ